jgi:hypothetical protein
MKRWYSQLAMAPQISLLVELGIIAGSASAVSLVAQALRVSERRLGGTPPIGEARACGNQYHPYSHHRQ